MNTQEINNRINLAKKLNSIYLDLSGLGITKIPEEIFELQNLTEIDLSYNQLYIIQDELLTKTNLQIINLSNNYLSSFEINLSYNYSIRFIDISNNFLYQIPSIKEFYYDVEILFDNNPFLYSLPDYILDKDLSSIEYYIESLKIRNFNKQLFEFKLVLVGAGEVGKTSLVKILKDDNFNLEIGKENKTNGIEINKMNFEVFFPATHKYLDSEPNNDNLYFKSFVNFDEIDYEDFEDFDDYYLNNEEFFAGKRTHINSVWHQLDDDYKLEIETREFLSDSFEIRKKVIANIWDFGGQEIYLNTHQFFLTNNSIYIILWDSRKDTESISFDYWLNLLNNLTTDSHIIIVMNKCENGIKSIDENYFRKKHNNIVEFLNVSCQTREGISELKEKITETIKELKQIGDYLPFYWEKIRSEIKNIEKDYISYSEYLKICREIGKIDNPDKAKIVSQYLHDIGDIIHFQNDNNLKTLVVINPEWATKAVYLLFDTLDIQKNKGKFTINNLETYWDINIYPLEKHQELVYLMEKFEICFKQIGTENFIIPDFLDYEKNTDGDFLNIDNEVLRYRIQYESLPSNLFTRLICKLSYLLKKDMFWKSSAFLIKENSTAYIKYNKSEKSINVDIHGLDKGQMLSIIINEIDHLHSNLKIIEDIDYKQEYACNCSECIKSEKPYYHEKKLLYKFLTKEKEKTYCQNSVEEIEIKKLINGYKTSNIQFELIYPIFNAVYSLQSLKKSIGKDENDRNTYISHQLSISGINAKDQSLHGESKAKIKLGELDIKFTDNNNLTYSLFEGVNLTSLDSKIISEHIEKSIKNYNPTELNVVHLGVYYEGKNFKDFIGRYIKFLNQEKIINDFGFIETKDMSHLYNQYGNSIIILRTKYLSKNSKKELILFHLLVDLGN